MTKLLLIAITAVSFSACNDGTKTDSATSESDTVATTVGTSSTGVVPDNNSIDNTTGLKNQPPKYAPLPGDVIYRKGKVMVWKDTGYVLASRNLTLDSGIIVKANGDVTRNGVVIRMNEGERLSKAGKFFNDAGDVIEDAWISTKKGVQKAGDAAKKVGENLRDSTH